jgi:hypothetical protein
MSHLGAYKAYIEAGHQAPAGQLASEARSLAFELSHLSDFAFNPVLREASQTLLRHWKCGWTNGGISEGQYRFALKSVALYLRDAQRAHSSDPIPSLPFSASPR